MADVPPGAEEKNRYKDILPSKSPHTISYTYLYIQYIGLCAVYSDRLRLEVNKKFSFFPQIPRLAFLCFSSLQSPIPITSTLTSSGYVYIICGHCTVDLKPTQSPRSHVLTPLNRMFFFFPHCYVLHGMGYGVIGITEASFTWYQNNHNIWHLRLKSP